MFKYVFICDGIDRACRRAPDEEIHQLRDDREQASFHRKVRSFTLPFTLDGHIKLYSQSFLGFQNGK
jgi:hypothetical protein